MLLLWPDRPKVHKRRVRIAAHAQSGAPPALASKVRVARPPLVHALPAVKGGFAAATAARVVPGLDLPGAAAVVGAPVARATVSPSVAGLAPPRALRRLFASPAPFMADRSPESDLVVMLSAATPWAVVRAAHALEDRGLSREQAKLVSQVRNLALGQAPADVFWGDSEVVDSLRLRLCRERGAEAKAKVRWPGFFFWAGRRLRSLDLATLPDGILLPAAAALVSVHGCRRAFELLLPRLSRPDAGEEAGATAGRLALRCALSGTFAPAMVRFLLPERAGRSGRPMDVEKAWERALLAAHAYRAASHDAGLTHVVAGVVATIVRDQVGEVGRRVLADFAPREWGAPPPTPEMEFAHRQVVGSLGSLVSQHWWTFRRPWPEGFCGPDPAAIERRLVKVLGAEGWPAHDVFLDDALSVAACHALQGHTPSALATLAAVKTPAVFVPVRDRLYRALERGAFDREAAPLLGSALSREMKSLLERLRHTPDPAEFGTPDWRREDLRGRLLSRLQQSGPKGLALALRTVLGKGFAGLDRFWLAPSQVDPAALADLGAWLDRQAPVVPSERDAILFLESQCQEMGE